MSGFSDYAELKILDASFGDPNVVFPTTMYVALCTAVPADSDTGSTIVEALYTGYARIPITNADMSPAALLAGLGSKTNINSLVGAACTAGSSICTAFAICDALTAGNMIWSNSMSTVTVSVVQSPPTIAPGALVCTLD